ncbi:hypothetical protein ACA910_012150 [Epithemia clementina (nom. ined.)]
MVVVTAGRSLRFPLAGNVVIAAMIFWVISNTTGAHCARSAFQSHQYLNPRSSCCVLMASTKTSASSSTTAATSASSKVPPRNTKSSFNNRVDSNTRTKGSASTSTTAATSASSNVPPRKTKSSNNNRIDNNTIDHWLPSVILKRNAQSKYFRIGNQLVFSQNIQRIQIPDLGDERKRGRPGCPEEPSIGQLVQVKVMENDDNDSKSMGTTSDKKPPLLLGWGVYNPESMYRVRILCHRFLLSNIQYQTLVQAIQQHSSHDDLESQALSTILVFQLRKAWKTRQSMPHLSTTPTTTITATVEETARPLQTTTNTFRLLNGEGDSLSGLAIDVIGGDTAVIMSSAAWCEVHKSTILSSLQDVFAQDNKPDMKWIWKTSPARLKQDGYKQSPTTDSSTSNANGDEGNETNGKIKQEQNVDEKVLCLEYGIQYATWPYRPDVQKTSVYCDQRENRLHLAQGGYCQDKRVLDLCCYHGGFAFNAILNGHCRHATGVDSSADAIETCLRNAKINGITNDKVTFVRSDVGTFLQTSFETASNNHGNDDSTNAWYDVVILDPPKLAPSASALENARRKYHAFNRDAIKVIDPIRGGWLLTCTCSAAMTQKDGGQYFLNMVQGAALSAGREVTLMSVAGAAPCHTQSPISWPAGNYLTAALFRVHPSTC